MDLIYSVGTTPVSSRKGKNASNVERALGAENLCQISSGNVIAFSASGGPEEGLNVPARGYHVFVADLNTPWDIHLVWSGSSPVSCLEWDATGTRLLVGHVDGLLQMLQSPGHVINSWHVCPHSVRVDNEQIVQAIFFHNGKKISIASDKKDSFLYNDKFQNTLFCPTLRHFGGRPTDGFIGVTSSGLLAVCAFNGNGSEATIKKFELSKRRSFVRYASMAYSKNGDVMVACSAGLPDAPVTVHQVSLRQTLSELSADVQQLPSVYLDCGARPDSAGMQSVACLRYLHKEDPSQLLVAAAGDGGGVLELWQLGEVPVSFGPIFKHLSGAEPRVQTWLKSASYQSQRPLSSIGTARVCLQDGGLPAPPIVTTMSDGGIVSLHRDSMAQMGVACAEPAPRPAGEPPLKLARSAAAAAPDAGVRLTDVALSSAGHLAAAVDDRGQLYLYRVTAAADPGGLSVVSSLVLQLEYYMVTGLDVWDLLVGLRSHLAGGLEAVCETLADTFHRQPGPVQQYYYVRHMAIKTSLYRLLSSGGRRVSDNNALLMLRCVASAFRALLRPAESSPTSGGGEAEPSEPLTALMASKPVEAVAEIDKVLAHLKERDAGAAADAASLAQLQHLAQWVTDLCLQGIATLADGRHKQVAVLRERQSLLLLRELLVMIRRWGAARPACLPVFHRGGDHTDVIALLFKLLTRLLSMHGAEPDEAFINEVSLLPAPGLAEHWSLDLPPRGVVAACVSASPSVRHYCYYDWEGAESSSSHRRHQEQLYTVDALRYLRLGARPSNLKHCTRCLAVTSARSSEQLSQVKSTPLTRAWDQRWTRACLCGGRWALQAQRPPGRARVM